MIFTARVGWAKHVARIRRQRISRFFGRTKRMVRLGRWIEKLYNIGLKDREGNCADCIVVTQDRVNWGKVLNVVIKIQLR
jgi:hypothetical protein